MINGYTKLPLGAYVLMSTTDENYAATVAGHTVPHVSDTGNFAIVHLLADIENTSCCVEMDGSPTPNTLNNWLAR